MPADLLSRLAAHVAATRDAPTPADLLIAEALKALAAMQPPLTYDDCRFYVTTAPDDDGNLESCLHDRLTSHVLESSRDDTYCHDQARWLNTLDAPRATQIEQLKQAMRWLPIAEAPHDTEVLLFSPAAGFSPPKMEVGKASWGWRNEVANNISCHGSATHYRPLPSPPERDDG